MMLQRQSYLAAAARLRETAAILERLAGASTPRQRQALTRRINWLSGYARMLALRHRRTIEDS